VQTDQPVEVLKGKVLAHPRLTIPKPLFFTPSG
jgi:hypothetical protein